MTEFKRNDFFKSFEVLSIVLKFRSQHPILTPLFLVHIQSNGFGSRVEILDQFEYRTLLEMELEIVQHFELRQLPILRWLNFSGLFFRLAFL